MSSSSQSPSSWIAAALVILFALWTIVSLVLLGTAEIQEKLIANDNDDILRYLHIKAWLAGQDWFDGRFYQMLAPEGLDLHWSRYVDVGIAFVARIVGIFVGPEKALDIAIVIWPPLLCIFLVLIMRYVAKECFENRVALFAVCALALYYPTFTGYFRPTRIDHHNIQILLSTLIVASLIFPGKPWRLGFMAGIASGLSLAIGLEALLAIVLAGCVLAFRAIWLPAKEVVQFAIFACTTCFASVIFFLGQTGPSAWFVPRCDVLSVSYLAATFVGALSSLALLAALKRPGSVSMRATLFFLVVTASFALLFPIMKPCIGGPFSEVPGAVKEVIYQNIVEGRSALFLIRNGDPIFIFWLLPLFSATLLGLYIFFSSIFWLEYAPQERRAFGVLLLFCCLGSIGALLQLRLAIWGMPAVPIVVAVVLRKLFEQNRHLNPIGRITLLAIALVTTLGSIPLSVAVDKLDRPKVEVSGPPLNTRDHCKSVEALSTLNELPSARVFASMNVSLPMLLVSQHIGLTGPYHRAPDAFIDGLNAFRNEVTLREALARTQADYLLLCTNALYWTEDSFATRLSQGLEALGFVPVTGLHPDVVLLKLSGEQ